MMGILVFTNEEVLYHKLRDGKNSERAYCYWTLSKYPKRFDEELESINLSKSPRVSYSSEKVLGCDDYAIVDDDCLGKVIDVRDYDLRLYLAIKAKVRGYFQLTSIEKDEIQEHSNTEHNLRFHSEDWVEIEDGEELKPSQGWRYYPK